MIDNKLSSYSVYELPVSNPAAVLIAIRAAQNVSRWGYFAALRYCQKRGVSVGALETALYCERNERRQKERLPLFLLRQAS